MNPDELADNFLNRSTPILTPKGIEHLGTCKITVAGCGGVGGAMALTLARMGVGHFHLADPADFDAPDMNRQWGAFGTTLGRPKVDVYEEQILSINPNATVKKFSHGVTFDNQDEFLEGTDVLVDCLDASVDYALREQMHEKARKQKIFSCVGPVLGFGCVAICSSSEGTSMQAWTDSFKHTRDKAEFPEILKKIFMPEHLDTVAQNLQLGKIPTLAVGPIIATGLLATEAIAYLLDGIIPGCRKPVVLPKVMFFDLYRMSYYVLNISSVLAEMGQDVES